MSEAKGYHIRPIHMLFIGHSISQHLAQGIQLAFNTSYHNLAQGYVSSNLSLAAFILIQPSIVLVLRF